MYNKVSSSCKYSLDSYNEKTTLGLVTQFFPILEMKIRQVASYCGISPFKNNSFDDVGVKYNDPSTLLTKIISIIYSENKDLISSQGFLFVYLTMYDSNFKNIRNSNNLPAGIASSLTLLAMTRFYFYLIWVCISSEIRARAGERGKPEGVYIDVND